MLNGKRRLFPRENSITFRGEMFERDLRHTIGPLRRTASLPVSKAEVLKGVDYPPEQLKTCKDKESELPMTSVDDAESDSIVSELSKTSGLHCRWSVRSAIDGDRKVRTCRRT